MADSKISALPASTTPLAGTEVLPVVQSGTTKQVSVANLTAGRAVSAASLALTTSPLPVSSGGTGLATLASGRIPYGNVTGAFNSSADLIFDGSNFVVGTTAVTAKGERARVQGGNGLFLQNVVAISSVAADIALGTGLLLLLRDNTNGGTALVLYENNGTPIIISQSGSNYVTGAPTGSQIQLSNRSGNAGVAATMASGQSADLNVAVISVDAD